MLAYPNGGDNGGSVVTFFFFLVGCLVLWRRRQRDLLGLLLAPLLLGFVAAALKRYPYGTTMRTMLYAAPAICTLSGIGLLAVLKTCLPRRRVRAGVCVAAGFFLLFIVAGAVRDVRKPYKTPGDQQNRQAVLDLAGQAGPADQWVVFNSIESRPGQTNHFKVSGAGVSFRYYLTRMVNGPILYGPPAEALEPPPHGRTWLLVYNHYLRTLDEKKAAEYLETLTGRWGSPSRRVYNLKSEKGEDNIVEAYLFGPQGGAPAPPPKR